MIEQIQYQEIPHLKKYYPLDTNTLSKLYHNQELIYKFPYYIPKNLKEKLEYIDTLDLSSLIKIKSLIYNQEELIGYSIIKYQDYKSLNKHKYRSLSQKKEDCYKIIKIFFSFAEHQLEYIDYHQGNILLNKKTNDIKVCDLDSINISSEKFLPQTQLKRALTLSLAYLYNLKYCDIKNVLTTEGIYYKSYINKVLENLDKLDISLAVELISQLEPYNIKEEKFQIKAKSYHLKQTGYQKFL